LSRKDLDSTIHLAEAEAKWFPQNPRDYAQSLDLNKHLEAEGAMSPGRVQDPEGAKTITISFNTAAGAVAAIVKRRFLITCYTEPDVDRLRLDASLTASDTTGARKGAKKILIYDRVMHLLNSLDPSKCGMGITTRDRATWAVTALELLEQFLTIKLPEDEEGQGEDMDTREGQIPPAHTAAPATGNNAGTTTSNMGRAPVARRTSQPRQSKGDTSPERRAQSAPVDPTRIKIIHQNRFHPLAEEHSQESAGNSDRVREG
jgi:hypothetical protein